MESARLARRWLGILWCTATFLLLFQLLLIATVAEEPYQFAIIWAVMTPFSVIVLKLSRYAIPAILEARNSDWLGWVDQTDDEEERVMSAVRWSVRALLVAMQVSVWMFVFPSFHAAELSRAADGLQGGGPAALSCPNTTTTGEPNATISLPAGSTYFELQGEWGFEFDLRLAETNNTSGGKIIRVADGSTTRGTTVWATDVWRAPLVSKAGCTFDPPVFGVCTAETWEEMQRCFNAPQTGPSRLMRRMSASHRASPQMLAALDTIAPEAGGRDVLLQVDAPSYADVDAWVSGRATYVALRVWCLPLGLWVLLSGLALGAILWHATPRVMRAVQNVAQADYEMGALPQPNTPSADTHDTSRWSSERLLVLVLLATAWVVLSVAAVGYYQASDAVVSNSHSCFLSTRLCNTTGCVTLALRMTVYCLLVATIAVAHCVWMVVALYLLCSPKEVSQPLSELTGLCAIIGVALGLSFINFDYGAMSGRVRSPDLGSSDKLACPKPWALHPAPAVTFAEMDWQDLAQARHWPQSWPGQLEVMTVGEWDVAITRLGAFGCDTPSTVYAACVARTWEDMMGCVVRSSQPAEKLEGTYWLRKLSANGRLGDDTVRGIEEYLSSHDITVWDGDAGHAPGKARVDASLLMEVNSESPGDASDWGDAWKSIYIRYFAITGAAWLLATIFAAFRWDDL